MSISNEIYVQVPVRFYVNKLVKAWHKHGKIIICVDYDDTLIGHSNDNKELCEQVCKTLVEAYELNAKIILFSCRRVNDIIDKIIDIENEYCFYFDDLNPIEPFKPGYSHKPYCNIMLDDKCGLEQTLKILQLAIINYKHEINNIKGCKS